MTTGGSDPLRTALPGHSLSGGRPLRWWVGIVLACLLTGGRAICHFLPHDHQQKIITDVISIAMSGSMAVILLWTAVALRPAGARFSMGWLLLGLSMATWMVGDVMWLRINLVGGDPNGSLADIFFLLNYPTFLAGVLCLPRQRRTSIEWVRLGLDLGVATCAGLAVLWVLIAEPQIVSFLKSETAQALELVIALAYPTGDLLLLWAAIALIANGRILGMETSSRLLVAASALLAFTDTMYGYQLLNDTYHSGNWLGILWSCALGLIGVAGASARMVPQDVEPPGPNSARPAVGSLVLSSVCFAIAWLVVAMSPVAPGLQVVEIGVLVMIVLTIIRQGLVMIENQQLTSRLKLINEDLDGRVRERTADLEAANERLRQAQKMEAIGRLAGGVAHDFNNLLTVIIGNTDLLRRRSAGDPATSAHLDSIASTAGRAAELTRQLLAFSRRTPLAPQATDLTSIVGEVETMLRRVLPSGIQLKIHHHGPPPVIYADSGQMVQVLMNLAINARDALPAGGTLTLATSIVTLSADQVVEMPDARCGSFAVLTVEDSGIGMDDATRSRLFEPFFTTKPPGAGTGLGLATVHGIVRQSGGWISVVSAVGQGSSFHVYLELLDDTPSSITRVVSVLAPERLVGLRILLVEDEPTVRLIAFHTLVALGCTVVQASDAAEALMVFAAHQGRFDLLISDGIMPGMRGQALIAELRISVPGLPAVLCSGYTGEEVAEVPHDVVFLAKPFTADTLALTVQRALQPPKRTT